jgi:hypothetical protein
MLLENAIHAFAWYCEDTHSYCCTAGKSYCCVYLGLATVYKMLLPKINYCSTMLLLLLAAPLYLSIVHVNVVQFSCQIFFGLYNNVLPTLVLQFIGSAGLPCPACYGSKVTPITQLKLGTITSSHDDALTL